MTTTNPTASVPESASVGSLVDERIRDIQSRYLQDLSDAVATLAKLRRGAGKPIDATPELWGLTLDHRLYELPMRTSRQADHAAEAAHAALTLYALHQQSKRDRGMHKRGRDLGGAVRRLMPTRDIDEPLRKRFVQAGSAATHDMRVERLRGIIMLLRAGDVPLDYALLADQLYDTRSPAGAARVRRTWGRGFQSFRPGDSPDTETPDAEAPEAGGSDGPTGKTDSD